MELQPVVEELAAELLGLGEPARATAERAYLKSDLRHYGTRVPDCARIARSVKRRWPALADDQFAALCRGLWEYPIGAPVHEHRMTVACLLRHQQARLRHADLVWLEQLLRESRTWALVDEIARHPVASIVAGDERGLAVLDRWLVDDDFWIRRSAVLGLGYVLREGRELDRFFRYADHLLPEREFFIRKVVGWVARDVSRHHPREVSAWVRRNLAALNGVTIREAVKYLPDGAQLLADWRAAGGSAQLSRRKRSG